MTIALKVHTCRKASNRDPRPSERKRRKTTTRTRLIEPGHHILIECGLKMREDEQQPEDFGIMRIQLQRIDPGRPMLRWRGSRTIQQVRNARRRHGKRPLRIDDNRKAAHRRIQR